MHVDENLTTTSVSHFFGLCLIDTMSFKSIPVLDLSLSRDPKTKPQFLADLRHALMEIGFLYLKNAGIPNELFQRVIKEGKAFFDIPTEEKYNILHLYGSHTR